MRWQEFIDGYDWKARFLPTAITFLPSFCTLYCFYPGVLANPSRLAGSSLLAFALIYLASLYLKDRGVRYAKHFWSERGGLPSTRFARMRDSFLSADQKSRIHIAVLHRFGIRLMSLEEECEYPALADRKIRDAFREVKELLRRYAGSDLLDKHAAEYGFVRNLCGSRMIFVIQAVGGVVLCGFHGNWPQWSVTSGCLANILLLIFWAPFAWLVLPRMLLLNADTYAGRAWMTFLSLAEATPKKRSTSVYPACDRPWASSE